MRVMGVVSHNVAVSLICIAGRAFKISHAFFASPMRTVAEVSHAPSFMYSNTTSCPQQ